MFCRIYISFNDRDTDSWLNQIAALLNADVSDQHHVEKKGFSLEIRNNKDHDSLKSSVFPDGFLYFSHVIELEAEESIGNADLIADEINTILKEIWNAGIPAVASCPFEILLLESGGYKSKNTPWK